MSVAWNTIATTWTTETAQWNAFPTDYLYSATLVGIFGASHTTLVEYIAPVTGAAGIFGAAADMSQNNESLYAGSVTAIIGIALDDLDILTWTPSNAATNSWIEQAAL